MQSARHTGLLFPRLPFIFPAEMKRNTGKKQNKKIGIPLVRLPLVSTLPLIKTLQSIQSLGYRISLLENTLMTVCSVRTSGICFIKGLISL